MKTGVFLYPTIDGPSPTWVAQEAESRGIESIFLPEHTHFPASGQGLVDNDGAGLDDHYMRLFDPLVTLGSIASVTSKIRIGTAVCLVVARDPIVTAKAVATLDQLSDGRVEFGVGIGWHRAEVENHGVEWATRRLRFEESIEAIRALWTEDPAEFSGELLKIRKLRLFPKPLQTPHPPIHVGGESDAAMTRAIRFGGWLPTHRGGDIARRLERLDELVESTAGSRPLVSMLIPHNLVNAESGHEWPVDRLIVSLPSSDQRNVETVLDTLSARYLASCN